MENPEKPEPLPLARDMTLRDHFAGLAMQSYMHSYESTKTNICLAYWSYKMADAMLDERNGKKR